MQQDPRKVWTKIRQDAVSIAEQKLRDELDDMTLSPEWHPYYGGFSVGEKGVRFTLTVRDGEREYFKRKKKTIPWDTVATDAIREAIKKHSAELVMISLIQNFNQTDGVEAE